jgi:hypothetical protein
LGSYPQSGHATALAASCDSQAGRSQRGQAEIVVVDGLVISNVMLSQTPGSRPRLTEPGWNSTSVLTGYHIGDYKSALAGNQSTISNAI